MTSIINTSNINGSTHGISEIVAIALSALQHWVYCPRQCGLIHLEQAFEDNIHTARGNAEHEKVDGVHYETRDGRPSATALPVWSDRVGLIGKCDVVEFLADGTPYPIEYKHGPKRKWLNDDIQLAAQAFCLEEMLNRRVPKGAIFHASSHRRREVATTAELKKLVEETCRRDSRDAGFRKTAAPGQRCALP